MRIRIILSGRHYTIIHSKSDHLVQDDSEIAYFTMIVTTWLVKVV